jgi:hypothetical protein
MGLVGITRSKNLVCMVLLVVHLQDLHQYLEWPRQDMEREVEGEV